jgi:hypothetical protein
VGGIIISRAHADGRRHFRWIEAQQDFRANSRPDQPPTAGFEVLEVDVDCSQSILDEIVKAVYCRQISVGDQNAGAILAASDFLQARLYLAAVLDWSFSCG